MSHVYKVRIDGSLENGAAIVFAINLQEQSLEKLKEEIFVRKPDLKNQEIYIYYFGEWFCRKMGFKFFDENFHSGSNARLVWSSRREAHSNILCK